MQFKERLIDFFDKYQEQKDGNYSGAWEGLRLEEKQALKLGLDLLTLLTSRKLSITIDIKLDNKSRVEYNTTFEPDQDRIKRLEARLNKVIMYRNKILDSWYNRNIRPIGEFLGLYPNFQEFEHPKVGQADRLTDKINMQIYKLNNPWW